MIQSSVCSPTPAKPGPSATHGGHNRHTRFQIDWRCWSSCRFSIMIMFLARAGNTKVHASTCMHTWSMCRDASRWSYPIPVLFLFLSQQAAYGDWEDQDMNIVPIHSVQLADGGIRHAYTLFCFSTRSITLTTYLEVTLHGLGRTSLKQSSFGYLIYLSI